MLGSKSPRRHNIDLALIGTRGIPARYGGFETAAEEIATRLVERGYRVVVYGRRATGEEKQPKDLRGVSCIWLPAIRRKALETLSHTAVSLIHWRVIAGRPSAIVFNVGNAPLLAVFRRRSRERLTLHLDGLESQRTKWGPLGRRYYRFCEWLASRLGVRLIADAAAIQVYYLERYGVAPTIITYGARLVSPCHELLPAGLGHKAYYLVVARIEPENGILPILRAFGTARLHYPLVIVGGNPYHSDYSSQVGLRVAALAGRVLWLDAVWDQDLLDALYAGARAVVHGHTVGGTNPSLLRAMGAGTVVVASDNVFNREVLGPQGTFYKSEIELANHLEMLDDRSNDWLEGTGAVNALRVRRLYDWDAVADRVAEFSLR